MCCVTRYKAPPILLQQVWVSEDQFELDPEGEGVCETPDGVCTGHVPDEEPDDEVDLVWSEI